MAIETVGDHGDSMRGERDFDQLFVGFVDRLNSGEVLDKDEIRDRHPEYAERLIAELEDYETFGDACEFSTIVGTLGDYTLRREIGRGGMGVVYDAWQNSMDRQVALKVLPPGLAADNRAFHRFMREAKTAGQLNHPHVVRVHGLGVEEQTPYYAMEFVDGETLAQLLARLRAAEAVNDQNALWRLTRLFGRNGSSTSALGRVAEADAPTAREAEELDRGDVDLRYCLRLAEAFADVADGLQHAHSRGVIHRDIKPSNLILDGQGRLRILDFGLARLEGQESLTVSGDLVGTVLYMSPEQAMAKRIPLDHRTDVYSLGATMYELLTLEPPFRGKDHHDTLSQIILRDPRPPRQLNPRVPKDLETIVLKCLRKDPGERYGTAEALAQDLRRFVRGDAVEARPPSSLGIVRRRLWRLRYRLGFGVVFLLLSLVAALWMLQVRKQNLIRLEGEYQATIDNAVAGTSTSSFPGRLQGGQVSGRQRMSPDSVSETRLRATLRSLDGAIDVFPERPAARYHRARARWGLGDTHGALGELDELLSLSPDHVPARVLRARLLEKDGRAEAAREELDEAERLGAAWGKEWFEATAALERGEWREAAAAYTRLIDARRESENGGEDVFLGLSLELLVGRAIAYFEMGDHRKAVRDLVRAHDRWPDALLPVTLLGQVYIAEGDPDEANEWFREHYSHTSDPVQAAEAFVGAFATGELDFCDYQLQWLQKRPWSLERERERLWTLNHLGRSREVIEIGERLFSQYPEEPRVHLDLGTAHLHRGDHERARQYVESALALGADDPEVLFFSKWIVSHVFGEHARGEAQLRHCLAIAPEFSHARMHIAYCQLDRDRPQQAIAFLKKQLRERPLESRMRRVLADAYLELGDQAEALKWARDALENDPNDRKFTLLCLAQVYEARGDLDAAQEAFVEAARTARPGTLRHWWVRMWHAHFLQRRGDAAGALSAYVDSLDAPEGGTDMRKRLSRIRSIISDHPDLAGTPDLDRLVGVFEAQIEKKGDLPLYLGALSFALFHAVERRNVARAVECAERALEMDSEEILALETLEAVGREEGDLLRTIPALERIVRIPGHDPRYDELLEGDREALLPDLASFATVDVLLERERGTRVTGLESAIAEGLASLPLDERRRGLLAYVRGRLLEEAGRAEEAIPHFGEAQGSAPKAAEPLLALARVLVATGQVSDAERRLGEALPQGWRDDSLWKAWAETTLVHAQRTASEALAAFPSVQVDRLRGFPGDLYSALRALSEGSSLRLNCGTYRDSVDENGVTWLRDRFYVDRSVARPVVGGTAAWEDYQRVPTGTERLFQERTGGYSIPLPVAEYTVRLWLPVAVEAGEEPRRIDVVVEGTVDGSGISRQPGGESIVEEYIERVAVTDGRLDIEIRARSGKPALSALEITKY